MDSTPVRTAPGTPSILKSPMLKVDTPYINAIEYRKNVEYLENENFTLKLLLMRVENKLESFLLSNNVQNDTINLIMEQERIISNLKSEIGQKTDFDSSTPRSKIPPQSTSLKQELQQLLDENLRLKQEIKKLQDESTVTNQHYSDISNASQADSDMFMNLKKSIAFYQNESKNMKQENEDLRNQIDELVNENDQLKKENQDLLKKTSNFPNIQEYEQRIEDLQNANDDLQAKLNDTIRTQNSYHRLEEDIENIETISKVNDDLKLNYQNLLKENQSLKEEYEEMKEKCFVLTDKLNVAYDDVKTAIDKNAISEGNLHNLMNLLNVNSVSSLYTEVGKLISTKTDQDTDHINFENENNMLKVSLNREIERNKVLSNSYNKIVNMINTKLSQFNNSSIKFSQMTKTIVNIINTLSSYQSSMLAKMKISTGSFSSSPLQKISLNEISDEYNYDKNKLYTESVRKMEEYCQALIHEIWNEFGQNNEEPHILLTNPETLNRQYINSIISIFTNGVLYLKQQLNQDQNIVEENQNQNCISPYIVKLIQECKKQIQDMSVRMASEHRELIDTIHIHGII